jgi:hypothetical protein
VFIYIYIYIWEGFGVFHYIVVIVWLSYYAMDELLEPPSCMLGFVTVFGVCVACIN